MFCITVSNLCAVVSTRKKLLTIVKYVLIRPHHSAPDCSDDGKAHLQMRTVRSFVHYFLYVNCLGATTSCISVKPLSSLVVDLSKFNRVRMFPICRSMSSQFSTALIHTGLGSVCVHKLSVRAGVRDLVECIGARLASSIRSDVGALRSHAA